MNKHDIIMLGLGAIAGGIITGIASFVYIRHEYGPAEKLEQTVRELEELRQSKCRQLDMIDEDFRTRSKEYEEKLGEYDHRLDAYEDELIVIQEELKDAKEAQKEVAPEPEPEPKEDIAYSNVKELNLRYVINDGSDRWDGPLTDDEQQEYDACDGDADMEYCVLLGIKERRFDESIDPSEESYFITQREHDMAPEFIETETLDYYEADDVVARGRDIVPVVESLINPIVLNRFGPDSQSGDPNTVWCRNDILKTDFEVVRNIGSYQAAIYGISEDAAYIPERKYNKEKAIAMEENHG